MPLNPSKVKETKAWLARATEDLDSAKILFEANKDTQWHQVLFFCQQVAEKTMKALLTWHETPFRWTHDLVEIGKKCSDVEPKLGKQVASVEGLTDYAWEFRYPGEDPEPSKEEARDGIDCAEAFFLEVLKNLPFEARPTLPAEPIKKRNRTKKKPAK